MKNILLILAVLFLVSFSFAQETKKDDWIRVQSDNGEFSIEVPKDYSYFYDKESFNVSSNGNLASINRIHILNAYNLHTLISFERYKVGKVKTHILHPTKYKKKPSEIVSKIMQDETVSYLKEQNLVTKWKDIYKNGYKIKQSISKNERQYTIRRYFYSKRFIYVLTASSREGKTKSMNRFLSSMTFTPNVKRNQIKRAKRFSTLKKTKIEIFEDLETSNSDIQPKSANKANPTDSTIKPFMIISQPRATYTNEARINNENGVVRLRFTASENGHITNIIVQKTLKYGLARNAILAAMRMKFLPLEINDKPKPIAKTVEYRFFLY